MWNDVKPGGVVGALWPDDPDGNAWSDPNVGFPPALAKAGFTLVDPGRFPLGGSDYSAQINAFKKGGVEIVTGVLPPPDFGNFWAQAQQQGLKPTAVTLGKALLFPGAVASLQNPLGLSSEIWWSDKHPTTSSLTGQTSADLARAYEEKENKQWTQPIGYVHSLFEVLTDAIVRAGGVEDKQALLDAMGETNLQDHRRHRGLHEARRAPHHQDAARRRPVGRQREVGRGVQDRHQHRVPGDPDGRQAPADERLRLTWAPSPPRRPISSCTATTPCSTPTRATRSCGTSAARCGWRPTGSTRCSRFADCREALRNWPVFSSAQGVMMNDLMNQTLIGIVLCADGEEHTAMRKVIGGPLTPQALAAVRTTITEEAERLVERLVAQGTFDAATELAHHLPVTIVSSLVGPPGGRPRAHARLGRRQLQLLRADEPADRGGLPGGPGDGRLRVHGVRARGS